MGFPLVTLPDLERRNGRYLAVISLNSMDLGPTTSCSLRQKC